MSFSQEWEQRFREKTHMSQWPWSDLVSLVMNYCQLDKKTRVLEIGCGVGANIPFFMALGVDYYAIEGSETAVSYIHQKYPQLLNSVIVGDFTQKLPFGKFDVIVDRAALTCNSELAITDCLLHCYKQLSDGGKYIGIDWYSIQCSDYQKGDATEDIWTKTNLTKDTFAGLGKVHFSDKAHLLHLFKNFKILEMQHKNIVQELPSKDYQLAMWNFVAEKS